MIIKKHGVRLITITLVVMVVFGYLIYTGVKDTMAYYVSVSELVEKESQFAKQGVRVGGRVYEGSIQWNPETLKLRFVLKEGDITIPVEYQGVVPDTFKQGTKVIIEGIYANSVFTASQIMPTCPSKYE